MTITLFPNAGHYSEARCSLPDCGEPLHIVWTSDTVIYLDSTDEHLRGPEGGPMLTCTWEVRCEGGHIVLLPSEDGGDWHVFAGRCVCNDDYPDPEHEKLCPHNDMDRLRAVTLPEKKDE